MSLYKKISILAAMLISVLTPSFVFAQYGLSETQKATGGLLPTSVAGKSSITEVVGSVVSTGLGLLGVIFFLLVLYAGFTWMIAMGNTEKVTKAKEMLEAAIIGLVIVLASYAISTFVFSSLAGAGGSSTASNQSASCTQAGGTCGDPRICSGTVITGLCPGGTNNVCCVSSSGGLGAVCTVSTDCNSPYLCTGGKCVTSIGALLPLNSPCVSDAACASNICANNVCASAPACTKTYQTVGACYTALCYPQTTCGNDLCIGKNDADCLAAAPGCTADTNPNDSSFLCISTQDATCKNALVTCGQACPAQSCP